jgi:hypothetical protein
MKKDDHASVEFASFPADSVLARMNQVLADPAILPLPAPRRLVSGRYRGSTSAFLLELRVGIDGARSMQKLVGDFYSFPEDTTAYSGSFVIDDPTLSVTPTQIKIRGLGSYTFTAEFPIVQVTVERRLLCQPPSPAVVQFFSQANAPGGIYICAYESPEERPDVASRPNSPGWSLDR